MRAEFWAQNSPRGVHERKLKKKHPKSAFFNRTFGCLFFCLRSLPQKKWPAEATKRGIFAGRPVEGAAEIFGTAEVGKAAGERNDEVHADSEKTKKLLFCVCFFLYALWLTPVVVAVMYLFIRL